MSNKHFSIGYCCAVANIIRTHGESTIAEDVLACNFMTTSQMKRIGVDESDIVVLKPIIKEIQRRRKL